MVVSIMTRMTVKDKGSRHGESMTRRLGGMVGMTTHTTVSMPVAPPLRSSLRLLASSFNSASLIFLRMEARQQQVTRSMMSLVRPGQNTTTSCKGNNEEGRGRERQKVKSWRVRLAAVICSAS